MSNKLKGIVPVPGTDLHLKYDFNLLCEMEDDHPDIMEGVFDTAKFKSPKYIRGLICQGLRDADEQPVAAVVAGKVLSDLGIKVAMELIGKAIRVAFGVQDDGATVLAPEDGPKN